jgi:hypothetical protein
MQSSDRICILIIGIFLLVIFWVWFLLGSQLMQNNTTTLDDTMVPDSLATQPITTVESNTATNPTILINTKAGVPFETPNFLRLSDVEQYDEDVFLVKQAQSLDGDLYQIFFFRGGSLNISLLDSNLSFARLQAENVLREIVPESDLRLCSLDISVTVPGWLSQQMDTDHSGIDYGLSFCPSGRDIL